MRSLFLASVLALLGNAAAAATNATVAFDSGKFLLADRSTAAQIYVDGNDWKGVIRVANNLGLDFGRVTGRNGSVVVQNGTLAVNSSTMVLNRRAGSGAIIAGTIGKSALIDGLVRAGKIDVAATKGKWEAYISQVVSSPIPGVDEAIVIAGQFLFPTAPTI